MIRRFLCSVVVLTACPLPSPAVEPPKPKDTQAETIKLTTPEQAVAAITVPEGFHVSLFASEPTIRNPIAITTDGRGRLWVAENHTYAERPLGFDLSQHDRISILEDTDHDGKADKSRVFWDKAQKLTSVEVGFGGIWALCPPRLLFIPDRNGDDVPDGEPETVLDGWDDTTVGHNIANGLKWGPDGWLYGRHGIQATSYVGPPGTPKGERAAINCGIWRYHPTRHLFEVVCRGGTNSWGHDWDENGELFYINTVIGHLWHGVPGSYGQRMYGEHDNPHLYSYLNQIADHYHWDTAETWDKIRNTGVTPSTDQAGGGHAHSGLMIYQGDNWPEQYRGKLFTLNLHGRRINSDTLERKGAGYVGRHGPDFLKSSDPWFRPIDLITGHDGGVYIADWTDIGECHENDGVHRSSGRIYKVVYGKNPDVPTPDIASLSDDQLVTLQSGTTRKNEWYARQAQRVLQERAAAGKSRNKVAIRLIDSILRYINQSQLPKIEDRTRTLSRAVRGLHVIGLNDDASETILSFGDEHDRSWVVRLLADGKTPTPEAVKALEALAFKETSGLVLLYLASDLQKMNPGDRWKLASAIASHAEFADDPMLPLMLWYGIEGAVPDDPSAAVRLVESSRIPLLNRMIARRLTENLDRVPEPVNSLVTVTIREGRAVDILTGMTEALRGRRKARAPETWAAVSKRLESREDENVRRLVRDLSVVFGDGRATDDVLKIAGSKADTNARRDALRVLVDARDAKVVPLLRNLITDRDLGPDAARGLAAFDDPENAKVLIARFRDLKPSAKAEAVVTLCARASSARALLDAVASGAIGRDQVPAFQIRQMLTSTDETVRRRVSELWPAPRAIAAAKRTQIEKYKERLTPDALASADLSHGRAVFVKACVTCHSLFGQGGKIGPDLTGGQRQNLQYLLENVVDPSSSVTNDYRMSAVSLNDGRVLNGIVGHRTGPTVAVQTPTERIIVNRSDIELIKDSDQSLMPEGLLDTLDEKEQRDLVGYLTSPQQVPMPAEPAKSTR